MSINTIDKQDVKHLHKASENPYTDTVPNQRRSSHGEAYKAIRERQDDKAMDKLNKWFESGYYESLLD